jgi:cyanophycinase
VLPAGAEFDLTARRLRAASARCDPAEADELASANRDLRKMARDIAAGDIGPSVLRRRIARRSRGTVQ